VTEQAGLRITVEDLATGEKESRDLPMNDFFIVCTGSCHIAHINDYPTKGTQVLTIKGRKAS
jgi:hypothetical protein